MSRQALTRAGWQNVKAGRNTYRRGKTDVGADLPIMPELADELRNIPADRLLFLTHGARNLPYKPETLGNWFRDTCGRRCSRVTAWTAQGRCDPLGQRWRDP